MLSPENRRMYAGMVAASGVATAKRITLRDGSVPGASSRFRPSTLADLPWLFGPGDEAPDRTIARLSSAAVVYSVNKRSTAQPAKILRSTDKADEVNEVAVLNQIHNDRKGAAPDGRKHFDTDRSCVHCRLLQHALYKDKHWKGLPPPIVVVNHEARINVSFDPETYISNAEIRNYQVIVPRDVAQKMIKLSHPLHWSKIEGSLFQRSEPVESDGTPFKGKTEDWEILAGENAYMLEEVAWPVNENLSADAENILRISNFKRTAYSLEYDYSLEDCLRSNFGVAWEPSGLDIDGGSYKAVGRPLEAITEAEVNKNEALQNLDARDLLEMFATLDPQEWTAMETISSGVPGSASALLINGWSTEYDGPDWKNVDPVLTEKVKERRVAGTFATLNAKLVNIWPLLAPFYLVDVSASKALHFTVPEVGPIELWQILTWTAPAILFTFLNRAICQAPHILIQSKGPQILIQD